MRFVFLFVLLISGLIILTGGERVSQGKICSKKIFERSKLKADDQLMVVRCGTDEVVAQLLCINWNCSDDPDTEGRFNRTGDLVLILPNCSNLDRFDAFLNLDLFLQNFTLEEPVLSSTKETPQTSSPNPPDSSEHLWLWLCALLVLPVLAVIGFLLLKKRRREHDAGETSDVSSTASAKNKKCKRNDSECAAVSFKTFREEPEDLRFSNTSDISLPPELKQKTRTRFCEEVDNLKDETLFRITSKKAVCVY